MRPARRTGSRVVSTSTLSGSGSERSTCPGASPVTRSGPCSRTSRVAGWSSTCTHAFTTGPRGSGPLIGVGRRQRLRQPAPEPRQEGELVAHRLAPGVGALGEHLADATGLAVADVVDLDRRQRVDDLPRGIGGRDAFGAARRRAPCEDGVAVGPRRARGVARRGIHRLPRRGHGRERGRPRHPPAACDDVAERRRRQRHEQRAVVERRLRRPRRPPRARSSS